MSTLPKTATKKTRAPRVKKLAKNIKLAALLAKPVLVADDDDDCTFELCNVALTPSFDGPKSGAASILSEPSTCQDAGKSENAKPVVAKLSVEEELAALKQLLADEVASRKKEQAERAARLEANKIRKLEQQAIKNAAKQAKELAEQTRREQEAQAHREYLEQLIIKGKASHVAQMTDKFNKQILAARTNNLNF